MELNLPAIPLWMSAWGLALAAVLQILFAACSALLERSSHIRLRHWSEEAGGNLRELYESPTRFEAYRFLFSLAARGLPALLVPLTFLVFQGVGVPTAFLWAPVAVAALLLFIEWGNRALVELHSEGALGLLTPILRTSYTLLGPLVRLLALFVPHDDPDEEEDDEEDEASDGEIEGFIDMGRREGILEPEDEELLRSLVEFGDTQARSVMTPRVEMVTASVDSNLEVVAKVFFESNRSRIPVYRGSIDEVVGILHIRDLFQALQAGQSQGAETLVKAPYYVPETKPLRELLEELQRRHQTMAIVVDEYGGVSGLLTVEDLVEEIVGEIVDEHESTGFYPVETDGGRWHFHGRTDLEEMTEALEIDLDPDDLPYETVSGLICGELGYVPKVGEEVETHGLVFEVKEADDRRIVEVFVAKAEVQES